jgi:hypothetical protein
MDYVIAQVNVARGLAPLDSPRLADFAAGLEPVNAVADGAPGFVWRLQTDEGDATSLRVFEDDEGPDNSILVNMSVWESVADLAAFVYGPEHRAVLRRRREWFEQMREVYAALWWIPRGHIPATAEAEDRIRYLRAHGPTPHAFSMRVHFPPPGAAASEPLASPDDWACTV